MYPSVARLVASRSPQHVQAETPCRRVGEPHRTAVWLQDGVRILERVNFGKKIRGGSKLFGRNITQALTSAMVQLTNRPESSAPFGMIQGSAYLNLLFGRSTTCRRMLVVECPYSDELNRRIQVFQAFPAGRMRVCLKNLSENLFWPSLPYEIIADFLLRNPYRTEFRIRCAGPVLDQRVMLKQSRHRRLVQELRCRYHSMGLLLSE